MKKILHLILFVIASTFGMLSEVKAQIPAVPHLLWGSSPFQDSLWSIDTTNWQIVNRIGPTLPGFTITGMNGLAYDPTTYETYIIMKVSAVTGRVLGKIDLATGICTQVGNLGDNFSSILFDETGQLWGATGDGATVPETLYKIDKTTAVKTLMYAMGSGVDGEVIAYNRDDNFIYHWSGNGTVVFEKFAASNLTYIPTNIPISGTSGGETFGAIYMGSNKFIISNISSNLRRCSTSGVYDPAILSSNPDDLRGLVMLPEFAISDDTICEETETIFIGAGNLQEFDSVVYHWGDSNTDVIVATATGASHVYNAPGTYTITIELDNGTVTDTAFTFTLVVNNIPNVTLSGITNLCPNDTITLTGSSGGTSQWYMNGAILAGETANTLTVTGPGVYNMIKTNLNGCGDSASAGLVVVSVPNPVVNLGPDTVVCSGTLLDAMNPGAAYLWSTGGTAQTETVTAGGTYNVMVTDSNNCSASDTIAVVINPLPVVNLGADTANCVSFTLDAGNAGATYLWIDSTIAQTLTVTASGTYAVLVTDSNGCSNNDSINVTINPNPVVTLGPDTAGCTSVTISPNMPGTFLWNDNTTGPSLAVTSGGVYSVLVTDSNGCSSTDSVSVLIHGLPTVSVAVAVNTICVDDADVTLVGTPAGGTYSGTSVTGSQFDPSIGAGTHDVYYSFTDGNGCTAMDTLSLIVSACVGIVQQDCVKGLLIYPNPAINTFTIELPESGARVVVTDPLGNIVYNERELNSGKNQVELNQPAGVYIVKVSSGKAVSVSRVVIRK